MMPLWVGNRKELPSHAVSIANRQKAHIPHPAYGLLDGVARALRGRGKEWIYFDHSYFKRGWANGNFRVIRNGFHLTEILDRSDDRLKKFGVEIEPWRKTGREIVIIPPSQAQTAMFENPSWLCDIEAKLARITDRPVTCKSSKQTPLRDYLSDAWAVVTFASVAGVEAALMGVPVFSTDQCPSWPISGSLDNIESPNYADNRREWASSLCYASWNWEEMPQIKWDDYRYEML